MDASNGTEPAAPDPSVAPKPTTPKKAKEVTATTPDGAWEYSVGPDGKTVWKRIATAAVVPAAAVSAAKASAADELLDVLDKFAQGIIERTKTVSAQQLKAEGVNLWKGLRALGDEAAAAIDEGNKPKRSVRAKK